MIISGALLWLMITMLTHYPSNMMNQDFPHKITANFFCKFFSNHAKEHLIA